MKVTTHDNFWKLNDLFNKWIPKFCIIKLNIVNYNIHYNIWYISNIILQL